MRINTHFFFSLFISALFSKNPVWTVCGGLFPDIDSPKFSEIINKAIRHRGIFHSVPFLIIVSLALELSGLSGFLIGALGHLFLDSFTKSGVRPFSPFSKKKIRGPFSVGGFSDKTISFLSLLGYILIKLKDLSLL